MKKITLLLVSLLFVMATSAQIDGFFPQFGQDAQWSVNEQFELVFTGTIAPAPAAAIATTFEGLVSDGIGGNDFTGLNMKFDAYIFDQPVNTSFFVAYNGNWSATEGLGVNLDFSQWLCQAAINFQYGAAQWMVPNPPSDYQAAVKKNAYNSFEIDINATGVIQCKLNGYVCAPSYTAPLSVLKPTSPATFYMLFACGYTGWKMKNLVVTKGGVTNKYFSDPAAGVKNISETTISVRPTASNGIFNLTSKFTGKEYTITNALGQEIQKGFINSNNQQINLSSVNAGTYMLVVKGEKACKFIKK